LAESLIFNTREYFNLEMKDVLISRNKWSSRRKDILTEIHRFYFKNINEISSLAKKIGINDNLYSSIKAKIYSYLMKNTYLLSDLTDNQIVLVNKFIIALFFLTRNPPFVRQQISLLSGLNVGTIDSIIGYLNLDIPKYIRNRSQIFKTLIENGNFLNKVLNSGLKENLLLAPNQSPTKKQLIENGYQQFIYSIERNENFTYFDVIKKAGLLPFTNIKFRTYFMEKFCQNLVDYINNKKKENIDDNEILDYLLMETEYISLLKISKIPKSFIINNNYLICLKVISFALLRCSNYTCLSNELMVFTGKPDRTIRRYINNHLPLLEKLYDIEINHWLPRSLHDKYTFDDLKKEVENAGFILIYPKKENDFNLLLSQVSSILKMNILIHCGNPAHPEYEIRFDSILNGIPCKYCSGYSLSFDDIETEVKLTGLRRCGREGILIHPKNTKEFEDLKNTTGIQPAYFPLTINCGDLNHPDWNTNYHNIQYDYWCSVCANRYGAVGNYIHPIFEYLTLKHLDNYNCLANFEHNVDPNNGYIVDVNIKRDRSFINNIERNQFIVSFPKYIENICIDFTISKEFKNIKNKFYKDYQSHDRFLLVVLVRINSNKNIVTLKELQEGFNTLSDVVFKDNIKLISLNQYKNFLNLSSNLCRNKPLNKKEKRIIIEINNISKLIEEALMSDLKISELEQKSSHYKGLLKYLI